MTSRRALIGVVLLALLLHAQAIARTRLPAQDGLKYIQVARSFQTKPLLEAIRGSDQHPLYPMVIAGLQPIVQIFLGDNPDIWRITAQGISAVAGVILILTIAAMTQCLFGPGAGLFAALMYFGLPLAVEISHETLSDSLALLFFTLALWMGTVWLNSPNWKTAIGAGVSAGLGFWTRPEIAVIGVVLILLAAYQLFKAKILLLKALSNRPWVTQEMVLSGRITALGLSLSFLGVVGLYALAKGEVSEKLTVRLGLGLPPASPPKAVESRMNLELVGLPPKEESHSMKAHPTLVWAFQETAAVWLRCMGFVLVPLAVVGAITAPASAARALSRMYIAVFLLILLRHTATQGYLSHRHMMSLVITLIPWAAWRYQCLLDRICQQFVRSVGGRGVVTALFAALLLAPGIVAQSKPIHASRMGHWAAGQWLAQHMDEQEAVLDTRCWAGFLSGRVSYGPWHITQALADPRLGYIVVEQRELDAPSPRAQRLGEWLGEHASLLERFPKTPDGITDEVLLYRFRPVTSQEERP